MAKAGEGDQRWIVEDRKDGTNVHNWHWAEKDVSHWARERLSELLGGIELATSNEFKLLSDSTVKVTGEAVVNNRKNKLIPAYELEVKGSWTGKWQFKGSEPTEVSGAWIIPYLAEENAEEDPEVQISTASEGSVQADVKKVLLTSGKKVILDRLRVFVKEMHAGGPSAHANVSSPLSAAQTRPSNLQQASPSEQPRQALKPSSKSTKRTFQLTEKFYARAQDIYDCFTDAAKIQAYTQSAAKVVPRETGAFEIFGGSVLGSFVRLEPAKLLVLDWRFRNWQEKDVSQVSLKFEEPELGTTIVNLVHSGIPEEDQFGNSDILETTSNGWKHQIFQRIRAVFGYGLGL